MAKKRIPLFGEDEATRLLAKAIALEAFRHPLEDLHGGIFPSSKTGDYSDVKVVTPYGEIPWARLGRITDEEMKELMIEVVSKVYTLLVDLDDPSMQGAIMAKAYDFVVHWDDPEIDETERYLSQNPSGFVTHGLVDHIVNIMVQSDLQRRAKFRQEKLS